jgi:hypothetical protein
MGPAGQLQIADRGSRFTSRHVVGISVLRFPVVNRIKEYLTKLEEIYSGLRIARHFKESTMSLSIASGSASAATTTVTPTASPDVAGADAVAGQTKAGDATTARQDAKTQLNISIVQSSLTVSLNTQNDPLALVLKSALTGINEALAPQYGENAIQNAVGQDNTPEGTASRIVSLSTGFYDAYKKQHPGEDDTATAKKFLETIRSGVEQGFKEAKDILGGLNVLNGDVASNVDKTYALVQKGLDDFAAAHGGAAATAASK